MRFAQGTLLRRLVHVVIALVVIVLVVVGVRRLSSGPAAESKGAAANNETVPVTASVASRQDVPDLVSTIGSVQSIDSVSVQARVSGPILKIEFAPGQDVKQGQELFLIDPRPYQAALDQVQAQLAHDQGVLAEAQVDLTRYQTLAQQNSIAKQQAEDQAFVVEQDKGTVQLDQANVETAQLNLEFCHVAAPISGRAGTLLVDLGNLVGPSAAQNGTAATTSSSATSGQTGSGTTMVMIAQIKPIYVSFNVPQNTLAEIQRNQAAAAPLEVDAFSQAGKQIGQGRLAVIDNQVNTAAGTVLMQATFANTDGALWPGEFVRVHVVVSMSKNVVTVPTQAVMAGPSGSYVYVINPDSKVKRVDVQVTARQNGIAVIGNGLSGGEKVVTDGQYRLDDGTKVVVRATTNVPHGTQVSDVE
jgi:membrane fusion protein, multidrug efflux system